MKKSSSKSSKKKLLSFIPKKKEEKKIQEKKESKPSLDNKINKEKKEKTIKKYELSNKKKEIRNIKENRPIDKPINPIKSEIQLKEEIQEKKINMKSSVEVLEKKEVIPKSEMSNNPLFLLSVRYNGLKNKAEMVFYDTILHSLKFVEDHTNHRPYFIVKKPINEILSFIDYYKNKELSFAKITSIDQIYLQDRLIFSSSQMTRVTVRTPADVPPIRDIFRSKNIETYESEIRYHLNWIFDTKIVPGLNYYSNNNEITLVTSRKNEIPVNKKEDDILKGFEKNKNYSSLIPEFLPFFTEHIPTDELLLASLDIEVENPPRQFPRADTARYPVICVSIFSNKKRSLILALEDKSGNSNERHSKLPDSAEIRLFSSEKELLNALNSLLINYPIIITFNGDDFDIQYLTNRMKNKNIRNSIFKYNGRNKTGTIENCIHIDLFKWYNNPAIKTYAYSGKYKKSSLGEIVSSLTNNKKIEVEGEISNLSLSDLIYYCWNDTKITLDLIIGDNYSTWKLMILLCRICHIPIDELVNKRVSSWLMYFLYYEHRSRKYLIPNSREIARVKGVNAQSEALSKNKKFQGAEVLEPKPGVHFEITVLDFASLYPSIISSRNLSYETINCGHTECRQNLIPGTSYYSCVKEIGIFSLLFGFLKDIRVKWFKILAKDSTHPFSSFYGVVEKSLKVLINAAYGVLGAEFFAFYCLAAAEATTSVGRFVIQKTVEKCNEMNIEVLYGDTDSVFVKSTSTDQIEDLITWSDKNLGISLEIDKIYRFIALSTRKKNYLGVLSNGNLDIKGLVGKKSNTPKFIQEAFNKVGMELQKIETQDDFKLYLKEIENIVKECYSRLDKSKSLEENPEGYTASELAFTIQMTKFTKEYSSKVQHVEAARKLEDHRRSQGNKNYQIQPGMFIQFIKTLNEPYPLELAEKGLGIDIESYKSHVHTTFNQILESLGIDFEGLRHKKVDLRKFF
ncbi:MAG: DNA polymerase 1 [Candidatus Heimdallarchaeota archaeon LC_3]|nr:MAG: DNA polymerase 1 [Candidatus Heimdallarchaeota archaeon LC_3]